MTAEVVEEPDKNKKRKETEVGDGYQPDLAQASLGKNSLKEVLDEEKCDADRAYLGVDVGDLLDSAAFARPAMASGDDAAISALAKFLDELVFGVNDESRVESGEAMPLHDETRQKTRPESVLFGHIGSVDKHVQMIGTTASPWQRFISYIYKAADSTRHSLPWPSSSVVSPSDSVFLSFPSCSFSSAVV